MGSHPYIDYFVKKLLSERAAHRIKKGTYMLIFGTLVFLLPILLIFLGFPIYFATAISSIIVIIAMDVPISIAAIKIFSGIDSFAHMAIAFFVLAGNIMKEASATDRIVDFADDCNIFVGSKKAAERVMSSISRFIEPKLRLKVKQEKSKVALSRHMKFLGMTIIAGTLAISTQSIQRVMDKVKELAHRGSHLTQERTMEAINRWYASWGARSYARKTSSRTGSVSTGVSR